MHFMLWLTAITIYLVLQSESLIFDDFRKEGETNWYGFLRHKRGNVEQTANGLELIDGAVYEYLSTDKSKAMDLSHKVLSIKYSASQRAIRKVTLRQTHEPRGGSSNTLSFDPELGEYKDLVIPLTEFGNIDLSTASAFIIKGDFWTLHYLELLDDPHAQQLTSNTFQPAAVHSPPTLIKRIDDFMVWHGHDQNNLNGQRQISPTAQTGLGFVTLLSTSDYVSESFTLDDKPSNMKFLAIKLVYSGHLNPDKHTIELIYDSVNGKKHVAVCYVQLNPGSFQVKVIPISIFVSRDLDFVSTDKCTIKFYGPMMVHSLDLVINQQEVDDLLTPPNALPNSQPSTFFDKHLFFRNAIQLIRIPKKFELGVDLSSVFADAHKLMHIESFRMDLDVHFHYIRRTSQAFQRRRFFTNLWSEISSVDMKLFEPTKYNKKLLRIIPEPNPSAILLEQYRFVGQMIGMAIINREMRPISFVPLVHRILLDQKPVLSDLDHIQFFLKRKIHESYQMLNTKLKNLLTMSITHLDPNQGPILVDLVPNGRNIFVNENNFDNYAGAMLDWHFNHYIGPQAHALRDGLYSVIPKQILQLFDDSEFKYVLASQPVRKSRVSLINI